MKYQQKPSDGLVETIFAKVCLDQEKLTSRINDTHGDHGEKFVDQRDHTKKTEKVRKDIISLKKDPLKMVIKDGPEKRAWLKERMKPRTSDRGLYFYNEEAALRWLKKAEKDLEESDRVFKDMSEKVMESKKAGHLFTQVLSVENCILDMLSEAKPFRFGKLFPVVARSKSEEIQWKDFRTPYELCWFEGSAFTLREGMPRVVGMLVHCPSSNQLEGKSLVFEFKDLRINENKTISEKSRRLKHGISGPCFLYCSAKKDFNVRIEKLKGLGIKILGEPKRAITIYVFRKTNSGRISMNHGRRILYKDQSENELIETIEYDNSTDTIEEFQSVQNLMEFMQASNVELAEVLNEPKGGKIRDKNKYKYPDFIEINLDPETQRKLYLNIEEGTGIPLDHPSYVRGHFKRYRYCSNCKSVNSIIRILQKEPCKKCGSNLECAETKRRFCPPFIKGPMTKESGLPPKPEYIIKSRR